MFVLLRSKFQAAFSSREEPVAKPPTDQTIRAHEGRSGVQARTDKKPWAQGDNKVGLRFLTLITLTQRQIFSTKRAALQKTTMRALGRAQLWIF